ncbi:hypothetical protein ACFWRG_08930 [Micromonospora tulbaghiae]|uniref:hypothetical protein n=1 Tax=Micromonospora tulbaghiae TaxID=479978 RepID=UPI00365D1040
MLSDDRAVLGVAFLAPQSKQKRVECREPGAGANRVIAENRAQQRFRVGVRLENSSDRLWKGRVGRWRNLRQRGDEVDAAQR